MVNILISGYYGFDNIGDESILRTLVSSLREHIPDCSLTVLSHNPASTREKYGVEPIKLIDICLLYTSPSPRD